MLRFRFFGIPFEVAPYFWIISALLGGNIAHGPNAVLLLAVWVACVFVSIVVHEMGHAQAGPALRRVAHRCGCTRLGGVDAARPGLHARAESDRRAVRSGGGVRDCIWWCAPSSYFARDLRIARRGRFPGEGIRPASLAGVSHALHDLSFINLVWTLFNLLPVLPLDGGLLLLAMCWDMAA